MRNKGVFIIATLAKIKVLKENVHKEILVRIKGEVGGGGGGRGHLLQIITDTSPYLFGNFCKLSLYNCFMPI